MERGELSDGSYWSITNITDLSAASDGIFKMDLRIHQTYVSVVAVFDDEEELGDCTWTQELEHSDTRVPTLELPGTMNPIDYYLAFHNWLHSFHLDTPLDPDMVHDFIDQVLECVFGRLVDLDQKVALCISADLHRVPIPIEDYDEVDPIMEEDEEDDDPMEYEPDEEEYDPFEFVEDDDGDESLMIKPWVQGLTDLCAVVAAEKHRKLGDCLICLDPLFTLVVSDEEEKEQDGKKYLFVAPCGHYFHGECMSKWLTRSVSCPLCRFDISSLIEQ